MLGSVQDAEDALQNTLLAAWQGLGGFEGRASLRTWLYRIATNRCLNARRTASRRPAREWDIPGVQPPEPTRLGEVAWLEPFPDTLLDGAAGPPGPEARYEQAESISLAFITALQVLPPRQPRHRPVRPDPVRRPDQRHDPLRHQRPAPVRPAPVTPPPVASQSRCH